MGWDFCRDWHCVADVVAAIERGLAGPGSTVLASGIGQEDGERCAWFAVEDKRGRWVAVALVASDPKGWWGFKLMDESMHPYFYAVPREVWEEVRAYPALCRAAREWRDVVANRSDTTWCGEQAPERAGGTS